MPSLSITAMHLLAMAMESLIRTGIRSLCRQCPVAPGEWQLERRHFNLHHVQSGEMLDWSLRHSFFHFPVTPLGVEQHRLAEDLAVLWQNKDDHSSGCLPGPSFELCNDQLPGAIWRLEADKITWCTKVSQMRN
jgi:hypothetical protein